MNETPTSNEKFHSIVLWTFIFMTHKELLIVSREFYLYLLLNTLHVIKNIYVVTYLMQMRVIEFLLRVAINV